jgi:proteasome alpha subunit
LNMQPGQMAYDRGITVFSPDGRLFQVEYAREAVKKGTTTIGLKFKDGAILVVDKRVSSKLVEPESIEKIYDIDDYIGCATSGLVADARVLVDEARKDAQVHKVNFGENISVEMLVKKVCDYKQQFTQYGGARPFGTSLLMAGIDDLGVHLFETDPSGALVAYKATCIGSGRPVVMDMLEKDFKDKMSYDSALKLGLKALGAAIEGTPAADSVEVGIVEKDKKFRRLSEEEISKVIAKL